MKSSLTPEQISKGRFWTRGPMVVTGCTKVSPGCDGCWAERAHVMRSGRPAWPADCLTNGRWNGKVYFRLEALEKAVRSRKPQVIAIWNDLFHKGVTDDQIKMVLRLAGAYPHHTYLFITKRAKRAAAIGKKMEFCDFFGDSWARRVMKNPIMKDVLLNHKLNRRSDNIWLIVTMENQKCMDERMPYLLRWPGKRGVNIEPCVGPVSIGQSMCVCCEAASACENGYLGEQECLRNKIHQVILGGETGHSARPMHPDWARSVRDQCTAAGVPFFFKGWGEWSPVDDVFKPGEMCGRPQYSRGVPYRRQKSRTLDGREHNELAWVQ